MQRMSVAFAISALGALHCNLLSVRRVFYTMARDGLFFRALAKLVRRTSIQAGEYTDGGRCF